MRRLAVLPLMLLAAASPPSAGAAVEVAVAGVRSPEGLVHVDICPEAVFLKPDCPYSADVAAVAGTTMVTIANVPPGRYAAQAFHDRNANHRVDRNLLGIPTERVGFSNDAPAHLRPPRFADAAFEHGAAPQRIAFTLRSFP